MKTIALLLTFLVLLSLNVNQAVAADDVLPSGGLTGAFSSWGKSSLQGDWKIVRVGDKTFIELDENFKAKEGPDVKIFLSPLVSSSITGDNATKDSIFVQQISAFEGKSRIEIPAGVDLQDYQSLVFHCEAYSKLWGSSPL